LIVECYEETSPDAFAQLGIPALGWRDERDALFEPLQLREETDYLIDVTVISTLEAAQAAWRDDRAWPLQPRLASVYTTDPPKRWRATGEYVKVSGRLNFRSHAGISDLAPRGQSPRLIEVVPRKLGYFQDFASLLSLISDQVVELLLRLDDPTAARFSVGEALRLDPKILLFQLRRLMSDEHLISAIETILDRPRSRMITTQEFARTGRVGLPSPDLIAPSIAQCRVDRGGPLSRLFRGFTPSTLPAFTKRETIDTPEQRYIKAFLEELDALLSALQTTLNVPEFRASRAQVEEWSAIVRDWLTHPLWRDVGAMLTMPANSQVLQRASGYREVLAADLALNSGIRFAWPGGGSVATSLDGDIRPVSDLYEFWCFFVLRSILQTVCGSQAESGSIITRSADGLRVELRRGRQSRTAFIYHRGDREARVTLFYNRRFPRIPPQDRWSGSYTAVFRPDVSILVSVASGGEGGPTIDHWLHFDAKYRLEISTLTTALASELVAAEEDNISATEAQSETYRRENLDEMHSYRDGVLGTRGAYLIYPGSGADETIFIRHPLERYPVSRYRIPSVGAFQLRPTHVVGQASGLSSFISQALAELVGEGRDYEEEEGLF